MDGTRLRRALCVGLMFVVSACADSVGDDPEVFDLEWREDTSEGRLVPPPEEEETRSGGGNWINNGLMDPNVSGVSVLDGLASPDGLASNGWLAASSEDGVIAIRYLVECALGPGQVIQKKNKGKPVTFRGRLGLAPEWENGPCGEDCQQWVSACLLARTNPIGERSDIWLQGDHPAIGLGTHPSFPLYEGSFYGNLFVATQVERTCEGEADGLLAAQALGRTCVSDEDACGFVSDGECLIDADCDLSGSGSVPISCRPDPAETGYHVLTVHVSP
ncbi:MAG: hypothetical protein KDK70_02345 [Myxococcales bacterium]|nr:hypothetical protein [Myxococcales bacterium]